MGQVLFGVLVIVAIVVAVVRYRRYGNLRPGREQVNRRDSTRANNDLDPPTGD